MENNQYQEHIISDSINMVYSTFGIDLDNDNDIDVLGISGNEQKVFWYENNGSNVFANIPFMPILVADETYQLKTLIMMVT